MAAPPPPVYEQAASTSRHHDRNATAAGADGLIPTMDAKPAPRRTAPVTASGSPPNLDPPVKFGPGSGSGLRPSAHPGFCPILSIAGSS